MKVIFTIVAVAALLLPGCSTEETLYRVSFQRLDKNRDGHISIVEATSRIELVINWVDIDRNSNGVLEQAEFSAFETKSRSDSDNSFKELVNFDC